MLRFLLMLHLLVVYYYFNGIRVVDILYFNFDLPMFNSVHALFVCYFVSWLHLRSFQDGYSLVAMRTNVDFIVLHD